MKILIVASQLMALVAALAFDAPMATPAGKNFELAQGWSPRPTEAPSLEELRRRQDIPGLLVAPDGTCGYVSGFSASPFGLCCDTCSCAFQTTPGFYGKFYCCNTETCESRIPTTCVDAVDFTVSSLCDSSCVADDLTMKCTAAPYTYCNLAEFETVEVQALFCDSVTISHTQSIYTTYAGEVGRVLTPFSGFSNSSSSSPPSSSSDTTTSTSSSSDTTTSTSSESTTSTPSTTIIPTTPVPTSPPQTSPIPAPTQPAAAGSSSPPLAAIVGGSVGGAAFIAIVGVLIFFLRRNSKRKDADAAAAAGPAATEPAKFDSAPPQNYNPGQQSEKPTGFVSQTPAYPPPQNDFVQQSPPQNYGFYPAPGPPQPQGYQQPQYPAGDNRYSQQPPYNGYNQYDPSQVGVQPSLPPSATTAYSQGQSQYPSPQAAHLSPGGASGASTTPMAELHSVGPSSPSPTYTTTYPQAGSTGVRSPDPSGTDGRFEVQG